MSDDKKYIIGVSCNTWLAEELNRIAQRTQNGEVVQFDLQHCFINSVRDDGGVTLLSVWVENLDEHSTKRQKLPGRDYWVCGYCIDCGYIVFTAPSYDPDSDYRWVCSNHECVNGKDLVFTGDMEEPPWFRGFPNENIGRLIERRKRAKKGLLQRMYEYGVDFRLEVDEENRTVGDRIMCVELLVKGKVVANVLSDNIEEAERWLLRALHKHDPATAEKLEMELKEEEADDKE